jgi:hypothetical protein
VAAGFNNVPFHVQFEVFLLAHLQVKQMKEIFDTRENQTMACIWLVFNSAQFLFLPVPQ